MGLRDRRPGECRAPAPRPAAARCRAEQALPSVGLAEAAGQLLEELSGGQQQRVAVARGLAFQGAWVLADEPTRELDAANRVRVMSLLRVRSGAVPGCWWRRTTRRQLSSAMRNCVWMKGKVSWVRNDRPTV